MYLLLIFALTFRLSTQLADEDRMLERIMGAMGEEGLAQLMNSLDDSKLDRLMDCLEKECTDEEFVEIMPRVLEIIKGINGGKAGCALIKTFIKSGAMYDLVTELREEDMIKIINDLTAKHLGTLIYMHKGRTRNTDVMELGKKLLPIIQKAKAGKKVAQLIETLKNSQQPQNSFSNRRGGRRSNNQGVRGMRGMQGGGGGGMQGGQQGGMSLADLLASMNGGGRSQMPGMQGGGGGGMQGMQGGGGGGRQGMNAAGRSQMPGMQGGGGGGRQGMFGGGQMPGGQQGQQQQLSDMLAKLFSGARTQ